MQALDIRPHSQRTAGFAVAGLAVLAAGAFSFGLEHQLRGLAEASPFPGGVQVAVSRTAADTIPEATPARPVDVAQVASPPRRHAVAIESPTEDDAAVAPETPPTVDAAANVPDPAPPPRDPGPDQPPT